MNNSYSYKSKTFSYNKEQRPYQHAPTGYPQPTVRTYV